MALKLDECATNKLDIVIVDPTRHDRCLLTRKPALVERAWIMSRPPAELLHNHKLVSAQKMQLVRETINCWTGEYTRPKPPPPKPRVENNCDLPPHFCMIQPIDNCSTNPESTCGYSFPTKM